MLPLFVGDGSEPKLTSALYLHISTIIYIYTIYTILYHKPNSYREHIRAINSVSQLNPIQFFHWSIKSTWLLVNYTVPNLAKELGHHRTGPAFPGGRCRGWESGGAREAHSGPRTEGFAGWYMVDIWLIYGWYMVDIWLIWLSHSLVDLRLIYVGTIVY